jgi:hypothetical protein
MTDRELMQQALDALESNPDAMVDCGDGHWDFKRDLAITALRAAIEHRKPVAWRKHYENSGYTYFDERWGTIPDDAEPLFSN